MESKKDIFKALFREFRRCDIPNVIPRGSVLPDWCLEASPAGGPIPPIAVSIIGPRRSGKTYRMFQVMDQLCRRTVAPMSRQRLLYINFEDDRLLPMKGTDLDSLLDAFYELDPDNAEQDVALFLDEIHRVEGWEPFIHRLLERPRIRVFLTGPTSRLRSNPLNVPSACRSFCLDLAPLDFHEYLTFKGVSLKEESDLPALKYRVRFLLEEYLIYGGFPEVALSGLSSKLKVLRDYYDLIVYKDIVEGFGIRNVSLLKELIKHLVSHVGSAVSLNAFYRGLLPAHRVSRDTVLEYVSYLERTDLVRFIPMFSSSDNAQRVNPKRVFTLDNGLRNAVSFLLAEDEERLAKNLVFQALDKPNRQIFYWRDGGGSVDFVTREDKEFLGINVAYGREPDPAGMRSLLALRGAAGRRETDLTVITKDTERTENGISFVPLWKWLLESS
jgi:hypothetical protein